ncbi:MAG: hypothetical protein EPGJADBJ_05404 [Saprospiraceae bacterium]|nr:hypothetical protein [Saprospiraceae bacterium]
MVAAPQLPAIVLSVEVIVGDISQLSVAVAEPVLAGSVEAPQFNVMSTGQEMEGGASSFTSTVFVHVEPQLGPPTLRFNV